MASSKEYLEFILGQLSELDEITYRAMMGEFIIYYRGKIVGGIYDDRLLVKPVKSAISRMPTAPYELPCRLFGCARASGTLWAVLWWLRSVLRRFRRSAFGRLRERTCRQSW